MAKILVSGEISQDLNATTPVVNYDHDIIKEMKVWGLTKKLNILSPVPLWLSCYPLKSNRHANNKFPYKERHLNMVTLYI